MGFSDDRYPQGQQAAREAIPVPGRPASRVAATGPAPGRSLALCLALCMLPDVPIAAAAAIALAIPATVAHASPDAPSATPAAIFPAPSAAVATRPARVPVFTVSEPWVRPAAAGAPTQAYLELGSSVDATLVAVSSPGATVAMVASQRPVAAIVVRAGEPVRMTAAGTHLALRVPHTLRLADRVPLTLVVRDGAGRVQSIEVRAEVRNRSPIDDERRAHGGGAGHRHPPAQRLPVPAAPP